VAVAPSCSKALWKTKLHQPEYFLAAWVCSGTSLVPQPSNAKQENEQQMTEEICEQLYLACQIVEGQLFLCLL